MDAYQTAGFETCCACKAVLRDNSLRFPKDPTLRQKWVDAINQNTRDYHGKAHALSLMGIRLCLSHFDENTIITKTIPGQGTTYALKKGSVPSVFQSLSPRRKKVRFDSKAVPKSAPEEKVEEIYDISDTEEANHSDVTNSSDGQNILKNDVTPVIDIDDDGEHANLSRGIDGIASLQEFEAVLKLKKASYFEPYKILYLENHVMFCMFNEQYTTLVQTFKVDKDLKITVHCNGQLVPDSQLISFLGEKLQLDTWTKFKTLVLFLVNTLKTKSNVISKAKQASALLQECCDEGAKFNFSEKVMHKWKFASDQINMSITDDPIYSPETVNWAFEVYNVNKSGYIQIFNSQAMTLPHPASLELYKKQVCYKKPQNNRKTAKAAAISTVTSSAAVTTAPALVPAATSVPTPANANGNVPDVIIDTVV